MPVATCSSRLAASCSATWPVEDYDLATTLDCGQAFRWTQTDDSWTGVVRGRWVRLSCTGGTLRAETAVPQAGWQWLADYLQVKVQLAPILATFPNDEPMRAAVATCRGLRLLRQEPWECLASFLLSSTKQIVQIRETIVLLCARHGDPVAVPAGQPPAYGFPSADQISRLSEADLRRCKMGFRAPHLLAAARAVLEGRLDWEQLRAKSHAEARACLMQLRGVGPKIADCVLLFACGFPEAFPVDVWVARALRELYFPSRRVSPPRLRDFVARHFGPHAGYAQQYLFHYMRRARG